MNKKLKIQFWKAEKALAMQILEQEGSFRDSRYVATGYPELCCDRIYLCDEEERGNLGIAARRFDTNTARDAYLKKAVAAITDELFTVKGELKIGERCEVRDDEDEEWRKRKLIAILPEQQSYRFVVDSLELHRYIGYEFARPITKRTEPKIEECGQLITYTWEEK